VDYRGAAVGVAGVAAIAAYEHTYALVRATRPPVWDLLGLYGLVVALLPTAPNISCRSVVNADWCWVIVATKTRPGGSKHAQEDRRV
jgi:hypothetical protein